MPKTITLQLQYIFLFILLVITAQNLLSAQTINTITAVNTSITSIRPILGIAVDQKQNVIITQSVSQDILKLSSNNWTIIGGAPYEPGYSGDSALATNANLLSPGRIFVDKQNIIYVIDQYGSMIRKIGKDGKIYTYIGKNGQGFSGDGGPVSKAQINYPTGIAFDSKGNIYIADAGNARIRKVDSNGIITTIAGDGNTTYNGENIPALQAQFSISGLACDKYDQLYFSDSYNHRVRKIDSNGFIITVAGNGISSTSCSLVSNDTTSALQTTVGSPSDVRVDDDNNVFFSTNGCNLLFVDTLGKIHFAVFNSALGAIAYGKGYIYLSDNHEDVCLFSYPAIYKYDIKTHAVIAVYSYYFAPGLTSANKSLPAGMYFLSSPRGVNFYNNNILISDGYQIKNIDNNGLMQVIAGDGNSGNNGYGDGGNALNARFAQPIGLTCDKSGNIFIADHSDGRIRKINKSNIISTFATLNSPYDVVTDTKGNVFVSSDDRKIYKINSAGQKIIYAKNLSEPKGLAIDKSGNLYVADYDLSRIMKVDTSGASTIFAGTKGVAGFSGDGGLATKALLNYPGGVGVDGDGNVFIADEQNNRIRKVDNNGIITTVAGGGLGETYRCDGDYITYGSFSGDYDTATKANLNFPGDITINAKNNVVFVDAYNNNIREVEMNYIKKPIPFSYGISTYVNRNMQLNLDCNLLCNISPTQNYLTALNDFITSNVWVEKTVFTDSSRKPYVSRHYQIYPVRDSNYNITASPTLYFTQAEFNGYNNKATGYLKLPASPNDQNGIHNLRVYAYQSKSKDSSGLPRSYTSAAITINPADGNIIWNADNGYWEVSFNVNAFGGFFIGTESNSLTAQKEASIQAADKSISIYPNPATDRIYVSLPETLLYKPVQLFTTNGKLISQQTAVSENIIFNVGGLSAGIYLIHFADGEVKKVIVSKK